MPPGGPMAVCGSCDARDGERIRSRGLSRPGVAMRESSVVRWVGRSPTVPSGREWNAELLSPRPAIRKMQGQPGAERVSRPAREKNRRRRVLVVAIRRSAPGPAGQVVGHRLDGQPGAVGGEAARGEIWFSPTPYLRSRMAFSISAWRRWSASSSSNSPSR